MAEVAVSHGPLLHLDSSGLQPEFGTAQENLDPTPSEQPNDSASSSSPFNFTPRTYQPLAPASSNPQHLDPRPPSMHRKGHSRSHSRQPSVALPAFNFNPGTSTELSTTFVTPPASPTEEFPPSPSKSGRHRRTTSEYIGGTGASGPSGIRSTSPSKAESAVSAPTTPVKPTAPLRGHRHRRSGAISSGDLSNLSKPVSSSGDISRPRASSFGSPQNSSTDSRVASSQEDANHSTGQFSDLQGSAPSPSKARVGFSDTVEFIPRPLSTISSATESSFSTMRGHSVSGSVSSIVSFGTGSPQGKIPAVGLSTTFEEDASRPRPKSAGAEDQGIRRNSFPYIEDAQTIQRPKSASAAVSGNLFGSSMVKNDTKTPKKFGNWAASLLSRQAKATTKPMESYDEPETTQPSVKNPILQPQCELLDSPELNENFDEDPTSTIEADRPVYAFSRPLSFRADLVGPASSRRAIDEHSSPLIDIDAAISSTGKSNSLQDIKAKGKSFSAARRSMHSSGVMSGFLGRGMNYHRRAESEPHLPFMDFDRSDSRALHSSSVADKGFEMENVFEEEAEDEFAEDHGPIEGSTGPCNQTQSDHGLGVGIQVVDMDDGQSMPTSTAAFGPRLRSSRHPSRRRIDRAQEDFSFVPPSGQIEIVGDDGDLGEGGNRSSDSTLTSLEHEPDVQDTKQVDMLPLALPRAPFITPTTSTESSLTPPYNGSSTYSTPRLDTSSSSFVEPRKYPSFTFGGESGPDFRQSVDGVPSLISSRSTVTSAIHGQQTDSGSPSVTDLSQPTARAGSITSSGSMSARRRKRSSVASLSRIMGGPFGTKSNLSVEYNARCQTSHGPIETQAPKEKRPNRLSRMFKFFKSREHTSGA